MRRARIGEASAIGAVHVAAWRSTYPGILPDEYLAGLSAARQAAGYETLIARSGVFVAVASGTDRPAGSGSGIVGFVTAGPARRPGLAEGEIETLYVLDDWRDRGLGRRLMQEAARHLARLGCRSVHLWVLRDNPSQWFYDRLGGRRAAVDTIRVAGQVLAQTAYLWDPIAPLLAASPAA